MDPKNPGNKQKFSSRSGAIARHLFVLELLRDLGPMTVNELAVEIGSSYNTAEGILKRMKHTGWVKYMKDGHLKGRYVYYLFDDREWQIEKALREKHPEWIAARAMISRMEYYLATDTGMVCDDEFKNLVIKVFKRVVAAEKN